MKLSILLFPLCATAGTLPPRAALPQDAGRLFAPRSWLAAPAPDASPAAPPPAAPTAPPLPFTFVGKFRLDGGGWTIYLARGEDVLSVNAGDAIGDSYRFIGLEEGRLVFEYLPLAQRQSLVVGAEDQP